MLNEGERADSAERWLMARRERTVSSYRERMTARTQLTYRQYEPVPAQGDHSAPVETKEELEFVLLSRKRINLISGRDLGGEQRRALHEREQQVVMPQPASRSGRFRGS